ncbi:hypothetical protein BAE44_0001683 [Dichanthelium oligosanthes]|uniref:Probable zinc-ribbon domain-containing protein n=1 Tax=Dichanthelium oligosanthes TaxID=888268 RepID=A0A1E5WIV0_9POAL|nr:hypothetical protein BAE44_0001683 [Dichanthelium oligosanthes]
MIYQDPEAVIYYCSKCRTPIRGKNPEQTEDTDHALSRLEILSADTASVFSDELDACPKQASAVDIHGDQLPLFGSTKSCSNLIANSGNDDAHVYSNGQDECRPLSRRTRRPACSVSIVRYGVFMSTHSETEEGFASPRNVCGRQRRRSLVGLQEFETSVGRSRPAPSEAAPSPLADPAFHRDLLHALDSLRGLIAAIEPASIGARAAVARRGARFFLRLESHLAQALPPQAHAPRRNAGGSTGSSRSSSASFAGGRGSERRRQHHCRPVLGGAPFLVCGGCSELLQVPATALLSRRKIARLWCGCCEEVFQLTAPAVVAGSATHQTTPMSSALPEPDDPGSCNSSVCGGGAQQLPPQPLHRVLGYSSPSPLLQSRRY